MSEREVGRLELYVPALEELWYRQKLMSDPATMSYNMGYDLDLKGYHRDTGCIDFPESEWERVHCFLTEQVPKQWYAYLVRKEDGQFIGEVNVHQTGEANYYEMGIVVEGCRRGQGYGHEGLALLLEQAFLVLNVTELRNTFEATRDAGMRIHLRAGFQEIGRRNGVIELSLRREEYRKQRGL